MFVKLIRLVTLAVIFIAAPAFAQDIGLGFGRLVSPGDLAKSHNKFNSITECIECHNFRGGVNREKCLDCHKDINKRIKDNKGFHAHRQVKRKTCQSCHPDHKGDSFHMVVWDKGKNRFKHDLTGYKLREKHKKVKCEACHDKKTEKGSATFLGAGEKCKACHNDIHEKTLSQKCDDCHINARSFKGQDVRFDHIRQAKYRLEGKHKKVACQKCHTGQTKKRAIFKVVKFEQCKTCHIKDDVHKGRLGLDCENCHTDEGWKKVSKFDHARARYKLTGKHKKVKCSNCHRLARQGKYKVAKFDTCIDAGCHDPRSKSGKVHGKQFVGQKCEDCHTVKGWKRTLFTHEASSYKGYKLRGKHRKVKCASCHTKTLFVGRVKYKPIDTVRCDGPGCHDSFARGAIHGKQFGDKDCASCHTEGGWKPTIFTHEKSDYQLQGKHAKVSCVKCHKPSKKMGKVYKGKRRPKVVYQPIDTKTCNARGCHIDVHRKKLEPRRCNDCHTLNGFKDLKVFDHTLDTSFPLIGKHIKAKCDSCHTKKGKRKVWKPVATDCYSCHKKEDKHKGALGKACSDCHHTTSWEAKAVAHEATGFPLTQTHNQLVCVDCHTKGGGDFSGLSRDCQQCHTDPHMNQMGRLCNDCHTMRNWEPMRFLHSMTGFRLEGAHRFADCADCHKNRIYRVTPSDCINCHTSDFFSYGGHEPSNTNCMECHTVYAFTPARGFNHSFMTFSGAHALIKSDCTSCHATTSGGATIWPGARYESDCITCHTADYQKEHRNCPTTCDLCHRTSTWDGASEAVSCD